MNRLAFGLAALATFSIPQMVFSQEAAKKANLVEAIRKLSQRDVSLSGSIEEEVAEAPAAGGIAGGVKRMVVSSMSVSPSVEYRGDVEIMAAKSGDLVVASQEDLPGIKVFKTGDDVLCVQAHTKEPFGTSELMSNVSKLVDWGSLGSTVESATKIRTTDKGPNTEYRVVLDASFLPKEVPAGIPPALAGKIAGGVAGQNVKVQIGTNPMSPSIIELAATFELNAAKEVVALQYSLQYDDPMKGFMAQALKGGGGVVQFGSKPPKAAGEADLGKLILYDFEVVAKPSDKVTEFVVQAKAMLSKRK